MSFYQGVLCNIDMTIVRKGPKLVVESHTGKNLGTYTNMADAKKRLKQVEFFKRQKD